MRWQGRDPWAGIVSMVNAAFDQNAFRFRNDDGSETAATWIDDENTNPTGFDVTSDHAVRLRIAVQETAGGSNNNFDLTLQYRINSGTWLDVNGSTTAVVYRTSSHVADQTATTDQLTTPTGTFRAGAFVSDSGSAARISFSGNDHGENEYSLNLLAADLDDGDVIDFRLLGDGAVLDAYSETPTITVVQSAAEPVVISGQPATLTTSAQPADPQVAVTAEYRIFRRNPPTGDPFDPDTDTPVATVPKETWEASGYDDEGLAPATYEWQVFAYDGETFSDGSALVTGEVTADPVTVEAAPAIVTTAGQPASPQAAPVVVQAQPAVVTTAAQSATPATSAASVAAQPASLDTVAQPATPALDPTTIDGVPANLTVAGQPSSPQVSGEPVVIDGQPATLTATAQPADVQTAPATVTAAPANLTVTGQPADPTVTATIIDGQPASITTVSQPADVQAVAAPTVIVAAPATVTATSQPATVALDPAVVVADPAVVTVTAQPRAATEFVDVTIIYGAVEIGTITIAALEHGTVNWTALETDYILGELETRLTADPAAVTR